MPKIVEVPRELFVLVCENVDCEEAGGFKLRYSPVTVNVSKIFSSKSLLRAETA